MKLYGLVEIVSMHT